MNRIIAGSYQFHVIHGDIEANLSTVESALSQCADRGCRLLVLPEMWPCGFDYRSLKKWAARAPEIVETMREWALRYGTVLVGSLPMEDGGVVYNTSYAIDSTGTIAGAYRKIHLFSLHGEDKHFGRGDRPVVCDTSAGRIGLMICYDLRFPELARRLAMDGAEILCVSALWPTPRVGHWSLLLRSRAVENQLFAVGCNGCGTEGKMEFGGASAVISPTGAVLAEAGRDEGAVLAEMTLDEITDFRRHIPCFEDRCPEAYERG